MAFVKKPTDKIEVISALEYFKIKKLFIITDINYGSAKKFKYKKLFKLWIQELNSINKISEENINLIITKSKNSLDILGKNLFLPLRIALIGQAHGPDLFTIIDILGINQTIKRIQVAC